jgi:protein-S-isoprenylcysteine O-methyltransferase Ste14
MGLIAMLYGLLCYLAFLASFLYAIGFIGDLGVPKTIDTGGGVAPPEALLIDLALLGLFAIQHSVMARTPVKLTLSRVIPRPMERSTYVLISSLLLALICWKWQALPLTLWNLSQPALRALADGLFALGWSVVLLSTFLINHFELFGLRQVFDHWRGVPAPPPLFKTPALYKLVRHPIYLGFVMAFWSTPRMTVGHLLFAAATTGYILVGIFFEERDLIASFGDNYRRYRRTVPMILPHFPRRAAAGARPRVDVTLK